MSSERDNDHSLVSNSLAGRACHACKARKRKCTRELPACSLCLKRRRTCSYQSSDTRDAGDNDKVASCKPRLYSDFPAAFFLDSTLNNCSAPATAIPRTLGTSPEVEVIVGDLGSRKALAAEYFADADRWLPIISRIRFYGSLFDMSKDANPGVLSILLAMKVLLSVPVDTEEYPEVYLVAKEFQLRLEIVGCINIRMLQSTILLTMYEIGHALYPAACVSLSRCAQYATILGIDETTPSEGYAWLEQEEKNRVWWAIIILDRLINFGFRGRHLLRPDPDTETCLPVEEEAWHKGILPRKNLYKLSSLPIPGHGRYARLAQAVNLSSQVFRFLASNRESSHMNLDDMAQLERTLFALEHLSCSEEEESRNCCLSSIATCYSSILLLRLTYLSEAGEPSTEAGRSQSKHSIRQVLSKTLHLFQRYRDGWGHWTRFPPLALDWLYRAAVAHIALTSYDSRGECNRDFDEFKWALETFGQRWGAAAHYLSFLRIRQAVNIPM